MSNIFDVEKDPLESPQQQIQQTSTRSGLGSFIVGTATLAFLAVVVPIYIHILVKIAIWSWNLI